MTDSDMGGASEQGAGSVDPRLETLLELWDRLDEQAGQPNTLGVTLMVGGDTYSGLLIPGRVWARSLAGLLRSSPDNHQVRALSVFFDRITESYEMAGSPAEARSYVHLANVTIGLPNEGKRTSLLMRIRTADVTGWTVGTMGQLAPFPTPVAPPARVETLHSPPSVSEPPL